jgi:protein-S-isoprenylcysteine O-methyltransferase Ste14
MPSLNRNACSGLLRLTFSLALCIFLPAWTVHYWQGWVLLFVLFVSFLAITIYLMKNDPQLLERRIHAGPAAETYRSQRIGQFFGMLAFIATFFVPAFDHRLGWSSVPAVAAVAGNVVVVLGLLIIFLVFKENSFTSATVEVIPEQRVISTGPYSVVRHPMYTGALIMILGAPLALGSWWGLATFVPMALVIIRRIRDEEEILVKDLAGYREYRSQVRSRLLPFVW